MGVEKIWKKVDGAGPCIGRIQDFRMSGSSLSDRGYRQGWREWLQ